MQKTIISLTLASFLAGSSLPAIAGIPTIDPGAIAQTVMEGLKRAADAKAAIDQAKKQFQQAKEFASETKERLEGFTDFKTGFDTAAAYLDDLNKLNNSIDNNSVDISKERKKYDLEENMENDGLLKEIHVHEQFYNELNKRSRDLDKLRAKFATAKTPAQKSDLTNQLLFAMLQLNTELKSYDIQLARLEKDHIARQNAASEAWIRTHSIKY